jgi:hypothetical protein
MMLGDQWLDRSGKQAFEMDALYRVGTVLHSNSIGPGSLDAKAVGTRGSSSSAMLGCGAWLARDIGSLHSTH